LCTRRCWPPGNTYAALPAPEVTVPEVTGAPMVVPPCETVKVTVPVFTGARGARNRRGEVTFWPMVLKLAEALAAVVVVAFAPRSAYECCRCSHPRFVVPLMAAVMV